PAPESPQASTPAPPPDEPSSGRNDRLKSAFNIYFFVFIGIVVMAIGIIFFAVSASKKQQTTKTQKVPSLTSQQISALKGNTTLVGDAKETLDVQSNSVFEGQVLVRSDLSVAGTIKMGGALSLPTLKVGNSASLGATQVNGTLGATGDTTLQGNLSVQKNITVAGSASFGSLAVSALSVTSLQLVGDLTITRHIVTTGTSVNYSAGTALGGGGTVSVSGTDTAGTITINTGNSPSPGLFATVNFKQNFGQVPRVIISPVGVSAGAVTYYVNRTVSGFSVGCYSAPPAGASFAFDYFVIQ
ncbi:MAG TPA: hypothetical protein VFP35_00010, partial [Candidatus Saccharimonadales bacterium]|nr:hypothetical protein [Candidatus Saccharimonadales bacterium]